eukprot:GHVT01102477.1.p1 GENE.GHVT01102477.1~~GHVT01102477.1.p1  ORF type:complete len:777 (+),score=103.74 GHVT01102477.1:712-3042(+)
MRRSAVPSIQNISLSSLPFKHSYLPANKSWLFSVDNSKQQSPPSLQLLRRYTNRKLAGFRRETQTHICANPDMCQLKYSSFSTFSRVLTEMNKKQNQPVNSSSEASHPSSRPPSSPAASDASNNSASDYSDNSASDYSDNSASDYSDNSACPLSAWASSSCDASGEDTALPGRSNVRDFKILEPGHAKYSMVPNETLLEDTSSSMSWPSHRISRLSPSESFSSSCRSSTSTEKKRMHQEEEKEHIKEIRRRRVVGRPLLKRTPELIGEVRRIHPDSLSSIGAKSLADSSPSLAPPSSTASRATGIPTYQVVVAPDFHQPLSPPPRRHAIALKNLPGAAIKEEVKSHLERWKHASSSAPPYQNDGACQTQQGKEFTPSHTQHKSASVIDFYEPAGHLSSTSPPAPSNLGWASSASFCSPSPSLESCESSAGAADDALGSSKRLEYLDEKELPERWSMAGLAAAGDSRQELRPLPPLLLVSSDVQSDPPFTCSPLSSSPEPCQYSSTSPASGRGSSRPSISSSSTRSSASSSQSSPASSSLTPAALFYEENGPLLLERVEAYYRAKQIFLQQAADASWDKVHEHARVHRDTGQSMTLPTPLQDPHEEDTHQPPHLADLHQLICDSDPNEHANQELLPSSFVTPPPLRLSAPLPFEGGSQNGYGLNLGRSSQGTTSDQKENPCPPLKLSGTNPSGTAEESASADSAFHTCLELDSSFGFFNPPVLRPSRSHSWQSPDVQKHIPRKEIRLVRHRMPTLQQLVDLLEQVKHAPLVMFCVFV